ncbi:uncharacterized protein ATNIH1004_001997 [Aspergillus tanneri]|uniref:Uncharacterized protein n=1 Tax=Aspergillus tanneri TaxID=1220188 RepID=A0A5M9M9V9_9EURO|nr:uncharacterized protein ATNIH1004_001997 [Aspergillus tanneri]KAA8641329.1 hypothetical protein ATNIH1004_001997 [Aspergillus tanneri]
MRWSPVASQNCTFTDHADTSCNGCLAGAHPERPLIPPRIATGLGWVVNVKTKSDAFLTSNIDSIPHLVRFYASCCLAPLVAFGIRICYWRPCYVPETWHRFALEQSARTGALPNKCRISQEPKLKEVILICCQLFASHASYLWGYDNACAHIPGGLQNLNELKVKRRGLGVRPSSIGQCVLEAFFASADAIRVFRSGHPCKLIASSSTSSLLEEYLLFISQLANTRRACSPPINTAFAFVAECWNKSDTEAMAEYGMLQQRQLRLLPT